MKVNLNSVEKVKNFVNEVSAFDSDVDLVSSRYVIDAKSLMGIFSLDLSRPIEVEIHGEAEAAAIMKVLQKYA